MIKKLVEATRKANYLEGLTRKKESELTEQEVRDVLNWQRKKKRNTEKLLIAQFAGLAAAAAIGTRKINKELEEDMKLIETKENKTP